MLKIKRSKGSRMRGSNSHGYGHKKKNRGAGNRGGVGNAGTGARADSKKPSILKKYGNSYFGKRGFIKVNKVENKILSLQTLRFNLDSFIENNLIFLEKEFYVLDLKKMGYDKLVGKSKVMHKFNVVSGSISLFASKRIIEAKGKLEITQPVEKK